MTQNPKDNHESIETLMNLFPKSSAEKLIWERNINRLLIAENHKLKTELENKNSKLIKELNFYKSLYDESELKKCPENFKEKIKNQGKELKRLSDKYINAKFDAEKSKEMYVGLKLAISQSINDFVLLLQEVNDEGNEFTDPVAEFFDILRAYKNEK